VQEFLYISSIHLFALLGTQIPPKISFTVSPSTLLSKWCGTENHIEQCMLGC